MADEIHIKSIQDMYSLITAMDDIAIEGTDVDIYTKQWVCQKDGFQVSDACVLQPFADAMDLVETGVNSAFGTFFERWNELRHAVAATLISFEKQEHKTVDDINVVLGNVTTERLPNGKVIPQ